MICNAIFAKMASLKFTNFAENDPFKAHKDFVHDGKIFSSMTQLLSHFHTFYKPSVMLKVKKLPIKKFVGLE